MAEKKIYKHHERTTTAAVEADAQPREIVIDPQAKTLAVYSESLSAFMRFLDSSQTVTIATTQTVTGNKTFSGTINLSALTASTSLALDASKNAVSIAFTGTGNVVRSASPTLSGTIGGALTFSTTPIFSALANDRILHVTTSGQVGSTAGFTMASGAMAVPGQIQGNRASGSALHTFLASNATPDYAWYETGAGADAKRWNAVAAGGVLIHRTRTDADGLGVTWLSVTRSGTNISSIAFGGPVSLSSTLGVTGNVGIGVAAGSQRLIVQGSGAAQSAITVQNIGADGREWRLVAGATGVSNVPFTLYDATAAANRILVDAAGNVGIGTGITPSAKLHVAGSTQIDALATGGTELVTGTSAGLLGKGKTIAGNYVWSGTMTISGLTSGRVPIVGASGLLTDAAGFTFESGVLAVPGQARIESTNPSIRLKATTAGANEKIWAFSTNSSGNLFGFTLNDAENGSTVWMELNRSGITPGMLTLNPLTSFTRAICLAGKRVDTISGSAGNHEVSAISKLFFDGDTGGTYDATLTGATDGQVLQIVNKSDKNVYIFPSATILEQATPPKSILLIYDETDNIWRPA